MIDSAASQSLGSRSNITCSPPFRFAAIDGDPTLVQSRAPGSPDAVTIVSGSRDALLRYSTDVVVANVSKFRVKSP